MNRSTTKFPVMIMLSVVVVLVSRAAALPTTTVVAITGDPSPDGNGTLTTFGIPVLNDAGQSAFLSILSGTSGGTSDDHSVILSDGDNGLIQIARTGQAVPGGNGSINSLGAQTLNEAGHVASYGCMVFSCLGGDYDEGIFRFDAETGLVQIVRTGQAVPGGNGTFRRLISFVGALNDAGQVAFSGLLDDTSGGFQDDSGVFRGSGGAIDQIAREGQAAPDGNGVLGGGGSAVLNHAGQVAFRSGFQSTAGGTSDDIGILRGDGSTLTQIVREGQAAPNGNGIFFSLGSHALNDPGQVAFIATLYDSVDFTVNEGIFLGDGADGPSPIVLGGQPAPDGNGTFESFFFHPGINNSGRVVFRATVTDTTGGTDDDLGIFHADGESSPVQISREGQAAPNGNGYFLDFQDPNINDNGHVLFYADLADTSGGASDDAGIFLFDDDSGLIQVARKGDELLGSTIITINLASAANSDESNGLNELGQIAYRFTLADGRSGVAIFNPSLISGLPGDFNDDGIVDVADYTVWRDGLAIGDYTQDDYTLWRENFGNTSSSGSIAGGASGIPEPRTLLLAAIALLTLACCVRNGQP